jgi:hypothetical protein
MKKTGKSTNLHNRQKKPRERRCAVDGYVSGFRIEGVLQKQLAIIQRSKRMALTELMRLALDSLVSEYVRTGALPIPKGKEIWMYKKPPGRPRIYKDPLKKD